MCIFCKIANGEIPSRKIYENKDFMAFLDIGSVSEGHTLVIPKKHITNIFDQDKELYANYLTAIHEVATILKNKLGVEAINIINTLQNLLNID